jgi:hypothetical protein
VSYEELGTKHTHICSFWIKPFAAKVNFDAAPEFSTARDILSFRESVSVGSRAGAAGLECERSASREEIWPGKLSAGGIGQEIDRRRENYFMARQPSFSQKLISAPARRSKTKIAARGADVFKLFQSIRHSRIFTAFQ